MRARFRWQAKPLTKRQQKQLERLGAEYDRLAEDEEANAARLNEIQEMIEQLRAAESFFAADQIATSGVLVGIRHGGILAVERGLLGPEDRKALRAPADLGPSPKAEPHPAGLSAALVEELTAHRTAALRVSLASNRHIALAACIQTLALPLFYSAYGEACLAIRTNNVDLSRCGETVKECPALRQFEQMQGEWRKRMPDQASELWPWLVAQDADTLTALLAACVASSINAVQKPHDHDGGRLADAGQLATTLCLDMAQWWQPTGEGFFARVSKSRILEAINEGCGKQAADNLTGLKKAELIDRAEQMLAGKGWLPSVLKAVA